MAETTQPAKRVLLKLSGESLMGEKEYGIDDSVISAYAEEIIAVSKQGIQLAIIVGGGNIYRGKQAESNGIDRVQGDHMGMLATMINSLALQSALETRGQATRLLSALKMEQIAEPFIFRRAVRHLEKGRVIIFGMGTGNPYFTTDTAAALRAVEIKADIVLKGTRVGGVYTADPEQDKNTLRYEHVSFGEVYDKNLGVMDLTSFTLCRENHMPIRVFDMNVKGNLAGAVSLLPGVGTLIDPEYSGVPVMSESPAGISFQIITAKRTPKDKKKELVVKT